MRKEEGRGPLESRIGDPSERAADGDLYIIKLHSPTDAAASAGGSGATPSVIPMSTALVLPSAIPMSTALARVKMQGLFNLFPKCLGRGTELN